MQKGFAEHFAKEWVAAWNSHDLERILDPLRINRLTARLQPP